MASLMTDENVCCIEWDTMDFGTEDEPKCGICGKQGSFGWQYGLEDIKCDDCDKNWKYDVDNDYYVRV